MDLIVGHAYKKLSTSIKYVLTEIEREKREVFVWLDGPDNTVRRVEFRVFEKEYKKIRVSKKTGS